MGKFINLSNHPVSRWPVEEQNCAMGLAGCSEIAEIRFPKVPTDASQEEVDAMARELLEEIEELAGADVNVHVLVQGEASLSHCLVNHLHRSYPQGQFVPVCATSERFVEADADGTKRVRHEFVMFREYTV